MNVTEYMAQLGQQARVASRAIAKADTGLKNRALLAMAEAIDSSRDALVEANAKDLAQGEANGLTPQCWIVCSLSPVRSTP